MNASDHRRVPIIGLCGGIGSGKSTVAECLAALGACVIDADAVAHREIEAAVVIDVLRRWWGPSVVGVDGRPQRKRIAEIVFADPAEKSRLEALLHPRILAEMRRRSAEAMQRTEIRAVVLDAPLLFESGLEKSCDGVIFVDAPLAAREARMRRRSGWTAEELSRREKTQQPLDFKRRMADYICVNNSDLETLRRQAEKLFFRIMSRSSAT